MNATKRRVLLVIMSLVLALSCTGLVTALALDNTNNVAYPFRTGNEAFVNAPTWVGQTAQSSGDLFQLFEANFGNTDFSDVDYIAVEIKNAKGDPGLSFGLGNSQFARYGTYVDGKPSYIVSQDGTVREISTLYSSINLGAAEGGMLLVPLTSLSWVGWAADNARTLTDVNKIWFETNAQYNWNFELTVGEIGYYKGDPQNGGAFTKLFDLTQGLKKTNYYVTETSLNFPTEVKPTDPNELYPFRKGEEAFVNAPTWVGQTAQSSGDLYQLFEANFGNTDFSDVDYIAVEIKNAKGDPGLSFGLGNSQFARYGTYVDGKPSYIVSQDGTVREISTLYSSINLGAEEGGMLLVPLTSLSWVGWAADNARTLTDVNKIWFETNAQYNWDFELTVGEIGYYKGDPQNGGAFTKLFDLTAGEKKTSYYVVETSLVFPSEVEQPPVEEPVIGTEVGGYPFNDAYLENAVNWTGIQHWVPGSGEPTHNWQTLTINLGSVDLSEATYFVIQTEFKGAPGLEYALLSNNSVICSATVDGKPFYVLDKEGVIQSETALNGTSEILHGALTSASMSALLIPADTLNMEGKDVSAIDTLRIKTNAVYNHDFTATIGEIGYYTGDSREGTMEYHRILDISNGDQLSKFSVTSDHERVRGRIEVNFVDQKVYGDTDLVVFGTGHQASDYAIWDGGSYGLVTMDKDSYGHKAIKMMATGRNPTGDMYTAITLENVCSLDWNDKKGVTLWARNDSDTEISFNIQMDCRNDGIQARFNIRQNYRFWLYDVNTGEQNIYMTRPEVTLPVGFEGWVRIPFDAFHQADWSVAGVGAMPRDNFMKNGSVVSYLAITIEADTYKDKAFTINKLGCYSQTPSFVSALVPAGENAKTIPMLMGLED